MTRIVATGDESEPRLRPVSVGQIHMADIPEQARLSATSIAMERAGEFSDRPWLGTALAQLAEVLSKDALGAVDEPGGRILVPEGHELTLLLDALDMLSRDESLDPNVRELWRRIGAAIAWTEAGESTGQPGLGLPPYSPETV